jgi:hypothetical protein
LDRPHGSEGRVHEQDTTAIDAERVQLIDQFGATDFPPGSLRVAAACGALEA